MDKPNSILPDWGRYIMLNNERILQNWLYENTTQLTKNFLNTLISIIGFTDLQQIPIPITSWVTFYNESKKSRNKEQNITGKREIVIVVNSEEEAELIRAVQNQDLGK